MTEMFAALQAINAEGKDANKNGDVVIPSHVWDLVQQALQQPRERELLEACRFFLNMLPNERHPNNPHGFATSYDLAAALDRHFAKVAP